MSNGFLPPYSDYQTASCKWLDEIPDHWIECRIKQVVSTPVTDGPHETPKFEDDGIPFLSAESVKDLKLDFARKRGFISRDLHRVYSKKYLPQRGDIYMVKSGATTGALAMVETDEEFNIWSPLAAIRCRRDLCFDRFVFYSMHSDFFQRSVELSWSFGTQQNIGMGVIENLYLARPPLEEQKRIAAFLDYETAKIDALIEKQQQLIALLGEKRQAVISHAVTKGLNPDAPMRNFGVEWLGEVPEHWTVVAYRHLVTRVVVGIAEAATHAYAEVGVPIVRSTNIKTGVVNQSDMLFIKPSFAATLESKALLAGDIVTTRTGANVGVSAVVPDSLHRAQCFRLVISTPKDESNSEFYKHFINSEAGRCYIDLTAWGSGQPNISVPIIQEMHTVAPPPEEQDNIVKFIEEKSSKFDVLISKAEQAVELLQERRTALISATVTGKIDVRGWKHPSSDARLETEMEVA